MELKRLLSIILFIFISTTCFLSPGFSQINTAKMNTFNIELTKAQFKKSTIDLLAIHASPVNFSNGKIGTLNISTNGFHNKDIDLDKLNLTLQNIDFDSDTLINEQELVLKEPASARAYILFSQNSLNTTLNKPKLLSKLDKLTKVKLKKFGIQINSGLISFHNPQGRILSNNILEISMNAALSNIIAFPVIFRARLELINNKIVMTSADLNTSGMTLPGEVTTLLASKLSGILDIDKHLKDDISVTIQDLIMTPGKSIQVKASAKIQKLKIQKSKNR